MEDEEWDENFWVSFHQPTFSWYEWCRVMAFLALFSVSGWCAYVVLKFIGSFFHV